MGLCVRISFRLVISEVDDDVGIVYLINGWLSCWEVGYNTLDLERYRVFFVAICDCLDCVG